MYRSGDSDYFALRNASILVLLFDLFTSTGKSLDSIYDKVIEITLGCIYILLLIFSGI